MKFSGTDISADIIHEKNPVSISISVKFIYPWIYPWIYCIYRYYLQRESFNIRSFLIVPLLKDHLRKPRRSGPHMNLIIMRLVLVSRRWNSARCNRAVLIGFIYKILFRSGILLFLRHVTDPWILHRIRIHIREILRLRIYPWILSMKKFSIHIRKIRGYIRVSVESPTTGSMLRPQWERSEKRFLACGAIAILSHWRVTLMGVSATHG